ncbi:MAG TPA: hypothetical protein VJI12_01800 [archaeon]|nr:hypothetical protein [archaeon]
MTKILFRGDTDIGFQYRDTLGERPSSLSHEIGVYASSHGYEFQRIGSGEEKALVSNGCPADHIVCKVLAYDSQKVILDIATRKDYLPGINDTWMPDSIEEIFQRLKIVVADRMKH